MREVPTLMDMCMTAISNELLLGDKSDDLISVIYELPSELLNSLLPHLPPLALQRLRREHLPSNLREYFECGDYNNGRDCRKRRRSGLKTLDEAWRALYKTRWSARIQQKQVVPWLDRHEEMKGNLVDDWQQLYWEAHLQDCVDAVAETALLPSYNGSIGEIQIPDIILEHIGCKDHLRKPACDLLKFSHHCQQFGVYARYLRLPNALCIAETCELLRSSMLENLELQWIKSSDHVEGLCKLLNQNCRTITSIDFIHCKFSPAFINAICDSLHNKRDRQAHGIQHFSMKRSSFLQNDSSSVPTGLSFITCGRSLQTLTLCDNQLGPNFVRTIFNSLLEVSSGISVLDLSDNNISGFLSQFRWRSSNCSLLIGKSLPSLRVLNLRCCNLVRDDADCLKQALSHMPYLENLDLSDNSIEDGVRNLICYFTEISTRGLHFSDLKLENCELSCKQVIELLEILSEMKKPLKVLSIKGNRLGSDIGAPLGKFICTGIENLDVEDIGLNSSGFLRAVEEISKDLKLTYLNISNNQGGIEAAKLISSLIINSGEIIAIDARYNSMSMESLSIISSALKASKAKLEHLDLTGNNFCDQIADSANLLAEFRTCGRYPLNLLVSAAPNAPYDDDP